MDAVVYLRSARPNPASLYTSESSAKPSPVGTATKWSSATPTSVEPGRPCTL